MIEDELKPCNTRTDTLPQWQDISTAPLDGSKILIWENVSLGPIVGYWSELHRSFMSETRACVPSLWQPITPPTGSE